MSEDLALWRCFPRIFPPLLDQQTRLAVFFTYYHNHLLPRSCSFPLEKYTLLKQKSARGLNYDFVTQNLLSSLLLVCILSLFLFSIGLCHTLYPVFFFSYPFLFFLLLLFLSTHSAPTQMSVASCDPIHCLHPVIHYRWPLNL